MEIKIKTQDMVAYSAICFR